MPRNQRPGRRSELLGVDNIEADYARFLALGAQKHEEPRDVGGDIKVAAVPDPFGNILGLIFNPHFDPKTVH